MLKPLSILLTFSLFLFSPIESLQKKYEVNTSDADSWLEEARNTFDAKSWNGFLPITSLEIFQEKINENGEAYVLFYNINDNATFSTSPFFKTSGDILKQSKPSLATWTVNLEENPEIGEFYGISLTNSIVLYFFNRAPIVFKFDQMQKTKQPIDAWMKDVKVKVDSIRIVKDENDMDVFENSNSLIFLIVDEKNKHLAEMFAAVSFNYPDLQFSYMLRNDDTLQIEKEINEQYSFSDSAEGSKVNKSQLILRQNHEFQF